MPAPSVSDAGASMASPVAVARGGSSIISEVKTAYGGAGDRGDGQPEQGKSGTSVRRHGPGVAR